MHHTGLRGLEYLMSISFFPPLGSTENSLVNVQLSGFANNTSDAFGRLRVSQPFTLFDSQSRFAASSDFSYATATGGSSTYNTNKSSINLTTTTSSGSTVLAQTYRVFPYQPGKSLLTMQTFTMNAAKTGLTQRVGYYGAYNGVYLEQAGSQVSFVIRTYTSGSVDNSRYVTQANWNVDKFDGLGPSGVVLDLTKTQILWMSFEWLGVGNVSCGFVIDGQFRTAHTFQNANIGTDVYIQTAILPLRFEITNTGTTASSSTLQQICSTVISEGGLEQISQPYNAFSPTNVSVGTSFVPLVSIRVNSSYYGAVVIPSGINFLPIGTGNYEIALVKNATLTGATWASTISSGQVDYDTAATSMTTPTADQIVQLDYATATNQASSDISAATGYNFDLQLGYVASLSGNGFASSDTYTVAAKTLTGTNDCRGCLSFFNLTA